MVDLVGIGRIAGAICNIWCYLGVLIGIGMCQIFFMILYLSITLFDL